MNSVPRRTSLVETSDGFGLVISNNPPSPDHTPFLADGGYSPTISLLAETVPPLETTNMLVTPSEPTTRFELLAHNEFGPVTQTLLFEVQRQLPTIPERSLTTAPLVISSTL